MKPIIKELRNITFAATKQKEAKQLQKFIDDFCKGAKETASLGINRVKIIAPTEAAKDWLCSEGFVIKEDNFEGLEYWVSW